tara:strand:- start:164 stop:1369 length:1206 start_codon:yes stop_codon:yes gene_type:complete
MGTKTQQLSNSQLEKLSNQIVDWQTVHTASTLNAVSGRGYFINTTSNVCTITLPGSPVIGDTITIVDYASTFASNNVTINPNGNKLEANTVNGILSTNDQTHTLIFTDSTQGWKIVNQDTAAGIQPTFVAATGGTIATSGDFKIHSFTGDANFVVSGISGVSANNKVSYLVVAGGGGGGGCGSDGVGGGGGAGGMREGRNQPIDSYTESPISASTGLTVSAQTYPITVGGGGAKCTAGANSVFATITSTGGGKGGLRNTGSTGGSGGGGGHEHNGSNGNTPPTSPSQGNNGGNGANSAPVYPAGGGGGSAEAGNTDGQGQGGDAVATSITSSPVEYAAGGGGGVQAGARKTGGGGGGGLGGDPGNAGVAGAANGGHGGGGGNSTVAGAGGSGIVIIRYKFQ